MSAVQQNLPDFEGQHVVGTRLKMNGIAGDPLRAVKVSERVYFVIEATIEKVEHERGKTGLERLQKARASQVAIIESEVGMELLDEAAGRQSLFGSTLNVDGSSKDEDESEDEE